MRREQITQSAHTSAQDAARLPDGAHGAPDLLRVRDICRENGMSDETLRRWRRAGQFPAPLALPGAPRWHRQDVDQFFRAARRSTSRPRFFASARRLPDRHARSVANEQTETKVHSVDSR